MKITIFCFSLEREPVFKNIFLEKEMHTIIKIDYLNKCFLLTKLLLIHIDPRHCGETEFWSKEQQRCSERKIVPIIHFLPEEQNLFNTLPTFRNGALLLHFFHALTGICRLCSPEESRVL